LTTEFGAFFRTGCIRNAYVTFIELKQCLVEVWSHFSQANIDEAINEWRKQLLACIWMKGHHF